MASPASAALFLATLTLGGGAVAGQQARSCPASKELGSVAYVDTPEVKWPKPDRGGSLRVLNLDTCRVRVLVPRGAQPPVRWSHDGRWLAFGNGRVVAASGGKPTNPLGAVVKWTWAPGGDVLAGITTHGGVLLGGPRIPVRRLLRDGSRVDNVAFDGSGQRLAVAQDRPSELSVFDLGSGEQTVLRRFSSWYAGVTVAGWSPNGRWVLVWGPYAGA